MTRTKTTFKYIALLCTGLTSFSAQAAEPMKHTKHHPPVEYIKPGAGVALFNDYDGQTQAGELGFFTITLEHIYSEGYISAQLLSTTDLQIHSDTNTTQMRAQKGQALSIPVQFSAAKTGLYYLGLEVMYENLNGEKSVRVLSMPISIGPQNQSKGGPITVQKAKSKATAGTGIISLPAQEVIK